MSTREDMDTPFGTSRIELVGIIVRDPGPGIRDPGSGIRDPGSGIRDSGFGIRDSERATVD